MTLRVLLLTPTAKAPQRAEEGSVGYDIHADAQHWIGPYSQWGAVSTGIAVAIPPGCYGRIAPRSGLAAKHGIDVLAGVVDPSYRGEVKVVLVNHSEEGFTVRAGDRIAQLILERCETPEVEIVAELDATQRGAGCFGSTGQ